MTTQGLRQKKYRTTRLSPLSPSPRTVGVAAAADASCRRYTPSRSDRRPPAGRPQPPLHPHGKSRPGKLGDARGKVVFLVSVRRRRAPIRRLPTSPCPAPPHFGCPRCAASNVLGRAAPLALSRRHHGRRGRTGKKKTVAIADVIGQRQQGPHQS